MMSVERRGMIPVTQNGATKSKPSKLQSLQADFQRKLMKEKEEKLFRQLDTNQQRQRHTLDRYQGQDAARKDPISAPGGVRSFFQDRKKTQISSTKAPNSAGAPLYQNKKREGYDKSRPLQPLPNAKYSNQQQPSQHDHRSSRSEPNLKHSSKIENDRPSEFERWRMEQDALDKQRRMNAMNKRNAEQGGHNSPHYRSQLEQDYHTEAAELQRMKQEEEAERRALALERQEEEKERKALLKQKQEEKRRKAADLGRRRREESERKQKELADELEYQREAEQAAADEQAEMIQRLEDELKQKQKDLEKIQNRRASDTPFDDSPQTTQRSTRTTHRVASPEEPFSKTPVSVRRTRQAPEVSVPTKPKKVVRKPESNSYKSKARDSPASTVPKQADASPSKAALRPPTHELNTTFKVSRENSIPINSKNSQEFEPFVTDGAGLDIDLSPCAVCGRSFASERLAKHQKACKKVSKPRKQFNITAMRLAGSGAEKYINKRKKEPEKKANKKNWRAQHEEFIAALRYAKKVAAVEAGGGNVADLPPPPKSENPDYVQCPHCNRKYNETAAERHIPKCKDIKAKPKMLKKGGRR